MILVIVGHGVFVWAGMSVKVIEPPAVESKPATIIQLEFITLSAAALAKPADNNANSANTAAQTSKIALSKPVIETVAAVEPKDKAQPKNIKVKENESIVKKQPIVQQSTTKDTKDIKDTQALVKNEPDKVSADSNEQSVKNKQTLTDKATNPSKTDSVDNNAVSASGLQSQNSLNEPNETQDDLSAMIRAVTAQFNREQAVQQRAAKRQANSKRSEQAVWQAQAQIEREAIKNMLALAAEQAAKQSSEKQLQDEQAALNKEDSDQPIAFLEEQGSWREEHEPITEVPLLVWRSTKASPGEVFIVLLELRVDKEGTITEVQLLESSGSPIIDAVATTQVRSGQLTPLQIDGEAVAGVIPMSLIYQRP